MSTFPLRIGTPDGLLYEGNVERVVCHPCKTLQFLYCPWHERSQCGDGRRNQTDSSLYWRNAFCNERNMSSSCNYMGVERRY